MQTSRPGATLAERCKPVSLDTTHLGQSTKEQINTVVCVGRCGLMLHGPSGCGKTMLAGIITSPHRRLSVSCVAEQTCGFYKRNVTCFCSSIAPDGESWVLFDDIDMASETIQHVICSYFDMFGARVRFLATCADYSALIPKLQSRFASVSIPRATHEQLFSIAACAWKQGGEPSLDSHLVAELIKYSGGSIAQLINTLDKLLVMGCTPSLKHVAKHGAVLDEEVCAQYVSHCKRGELGRAIKSIIGLYDDGFTGYDIIASLQKTFLHGNDSVVAWALPMCSATIGVQARQDDITELFFFTAELVNALLPENIAIQ